MSEQRKWAHNDLALDLAAHLRGNSDRVIWTDMQLGPSGSPRPDVYSIPKSFSKFTPLAYECKISIADFRRDVTAGKWQSYLKFAAGVIFAAPAGLLKKEDIPAGCGLIVRHDEVWRTVKGPTLRAIETLPHDAWMKLIIDGLERAQRTDPSPRNSDSWTVQRSIRKKFGDGLADALRDRDTAEIYLRHQEMEARQSAEQLKVQADEQMKWARERAERDVIELRRAQREFAVAMGLPEDANTYQIHSACNEAAKRLNGDGEIARLRKHLERIQHELQDGLKELPQIARAA